MSCRMHKDIRSCLRLEGNKNLIARHISNDKALTAGTIML